MIPTSSISRAGRGLFLLVFICTLGGLTLTAMIRRALVDAPASVEVEFPASKQLRVDGWRGPAELEAAGIAFRLTPLHADPERQAFDSEALERALGLPAGSPYRLEIQVGDKFDAVEAFASIGDLLTAPSASLAIEDSEGIVAQEMTHLASSDAPALRALFQSGATLLESKGQIVMWGTLPAPESELRLSDGTQGLTLRAALYEGSKLPQHVAFLLPPVENMDSKGTSVAK